MQVGRYVRSLQAYVFIILEEKLALQWRIFRGGISSKIPELKPEAGKKVFESKFPIVPDLVTRRQKRNIKRTISCYLLQYHPGPPVTMLEEPELFIGRDLKYIK